MSDTTRRLGSSPAIREPKVPDTSSKDGDVCRTAISIILPHLPCDLGASQHLNFIQLQYTQYGPALHVEDSLRLAEHGLCDAFL